MTLDPLAGKWQLFCSSSQLLTELKNTWSGVLSGDCSVRRRHMHAYIHKWIYREPHIHKGKYCIRTQYGPKYMKNACMCAGDCTVFFYVFFSFAFSQTHTHIYAYTYCNIKQQKSGLWPRPHEEWSHGKSRTNREIRHCKVMPFKCTFSVAGLVNSTHI